MSIRLFQFPIAGIVRVSGEDALPYLQSQLTIDLRKLPIGSIRSGLRLGLKGKVSFGALILRTGEEEYQLICRDCPAADAIMLLEENMVADEVEFSELCGKWKISAIHHPDSISEAKRFVNLPDLQAGRFTMGQSGWIYVDCGTLPGSCVCFLHQGDLKAPWIDGLVPTEAHQVELLRLQAGLFRPGLEIGSEELPQEGELERLAVDFDKGCYLGQEVMARIHAMGRVRRKAVAVRGSTCENSSTTSLFDRGKKVGEIKSRFFNAPRKEWVGAAVIHEKSLPSLIKEGLTLEGTVELVHPLSK